MELTQEIVRELFDYDQESGKLFWKIRDVKFFTDKGPCKTWNTKYANTEAFTFISAGYQKGRIFDKAYQAHRIIWLWMTGEWPEQVDHINSVRNDNSWGNLRNVSHKENGKNQRLRKNNSSGFQGVCWHKRANKWIANIHVDGKTIHLGLFKHLEQAVYARKEAEMRYGFHENHGKK